VWTVVFHPEAEVELGRLMATERVAILNAVEKLKALGPGLPFPHQSNVQGAASLRELRPRAGRSRWRGFYGQVGDVLVMLAVGPEAKVDPRGFTRAVRAATARLVEVEP
jgi:hypothetical protein